MGYVRPSDEGRYVLDLDVQFVEVVVDPKTDVSKLTVYLYDNKGTVYRKLQLADANLFRVSKVAGSSAQIYAANLPGGSIQNGPGDGIALVLDDSKVVQFLSFQGTITAVEGPASGSVSQDVGVQESSSTPPGGSIGLSGSGDRYSDFQWRLLTRAASPGSVNSGQMIS